MSTLVAVPFRSLDTAAQAHPTPPPLAMKLRAVPAEASAPALIEELRAFLRELPPHLGPPCLFFYVTACKPAEAFGLTWDQVSSEDRIIRFKARTIHFDQHPAVAALLDRQRAVSVGGSPWVFHRGGRRIKTKTHYPFSRARQATGCKLNLLSLRSAAIQNLRLAGLSGRVSWAISSGGVLRATQDEINAGVATLARFLGPFEIGGFGLQHPQHKAKPERMRHPEDSTLPGTVTTFLNYLRNLRGCSPHTLRAYGFELDRLSTWAKEHLGREAACPEDATPELLRGFIGWRAKSTVKATTLQRTYGVLKSFILWAMPRGKVAPLIIYEIPKVSIPDPLPQFVPQRQLCNLLNLETKMTCDVRGLRRLVIVELLYGTGIRANELATLTRQGLEVDRGLIRVMGKGRRERLVPIGSMALKAVYRLWAATSYNPRPEEPVIRGRDKAMSVRTIEREVAAFLAGLGPNVATWPHAMRHSFATHLLDRGAGIRAIQELLGHSKVTTTQRYTAVATSRLRAAYNQAFPR